MLTISRRTLLQGASTLAIANAMPEAMAARLGRSNAPFTSFNGGTTQTNTQCAQYGGNYIFANMIKMSQRIEYQTPNGIPRGAPGNPIIELDANGYPTKEVAGGYHSIVQIPNASQYSGIWVMKWDGTGTVLISWSGGSASGRHGRFTFVNTDKTAGGTRLSWEVTAFSNAPNHVQNLRLCRLVDEAGVDNGTIVFFEDHLNMMRSAKPGCIRSLNWGGGFSGTNNATLATWSQRRPRGFITYQGDSFFNPNWWPGGSGTTTNSGTDYTLSYRGFSLTDKVAVQCIFNVSCVNRIGQTLNWTTTSGNPIVINWATNGTSAPHNLVAGNSVVFGVANVPSIMPPAPILCGVLYYVSASGLTPNSFQIAATPGGSVINATESKSGRLQAMSVCRININDTGFVPITDLQYPLPNGTFFTSTGPSAGNYTNNVSTLVYDATTGWFRLQAPGQGMINGSPPELFIDYCAMIGAHPWLTAPFLSLTTGAGPGITDYMTSWASYATTKYPWMKPVLEPFNETWGGGYGTYYAQHLAQTLWGTPGAQIADALNQGYGKWVSDLGQAMSTLYGNDRTKYSSICSIQTAIISQATSVRINDNRLICSAYVAAGGQPAYKFCDRVCGANYYCPTERFSVQEMIDAFNYVVTNRGTIYPTTAPQLAIANGYAATADTGVSASFNLTFVQNCFTNLKTWGQGQGIRSSVPLCNALGGTSGNTIAGIVSYEGGWSPDLLRGNWTTTVATGAGLITQANPCVVTLNTANTRSSESGPFSGNPAVAGMVIGFTGVGGMTQLNNPALSCTFPKNGTCDITATNSLLVNQAMTFQTNAGGVPTGSGILPDTAYYVVAATSSTFQISATRGGTPITFTSGGTRTANPGWFVTAVGTRTITLDVDSTAFSAWTSGGTGTWLNSQAYSNVLRIAGGNSPETGTLNTKWYGIYAGLASSGFVAEFPSDYLYFSPAQIWGVLQSIYDVPTPRWNSILAANN